MSRLAGRGRGGHPVLVGAALAVVLGGAARPAPLPAQTVHAVLFHSPTCPHCRRVISQDLPIFFQVYGGEPRVTEAGSYLALVTNGELEMLFVDASQPEGLALYRESFVTHPVSEDRTGVPRLIVGDSVLVGEVEIPGRLHAIIRAGLAAGGIPWPAIPGLADAVATAERVAGTTAGATTGAAETAAGATADTAADTAAGATADTAAGMAAGGMPRDSATATDTGAGPRLGDLAVPRRVTVGERLRRDPVGNGMAIAVLALLIAVVVAAFADVPARRGPREPGLWMPALAVVGAAVAGYLTYIETSGVRAICGPVGDCNTVQQSPYAMVFGIPVGMLGLAGYGVVLVLWVMSQEGRPSAEGTRRLLFGATMAGTVFSIYLTFLEPFVIGATCAWCLTSALVMAALLWLAAAWSKPLPGQ